MTHEQFNAPHPVPENSYGATYGEHREFLERRNWCWEQWGPSEELEFHVKGDGTNPAWCWILENPYVYSEKMRIYFSTEKELSWYILKWGEQ